MCLGSGHVVEVAQSMFTEWYNQISNNLCEDVVLDSFNKAYRDEDNILDKIHESIYIQIGFMKILILIRKYLQSQL